jgi:hypothetical protein
MVRNLIICGIICYRMIPVRIRTYWSFGSSTSHIALQLVREAATDLEAIKAFLPWIGIGTKPDGYGPQVRIGIGNPGIMDANNTW